MYFVLLYINIIITLAKDQWDHQTTFSAIIVFLTVLIELYVYIFLIFNQHYKK